LHETNRKLISPIMGDRRLVRSKSILAWLILLAGLVQGVAAGQSGNGYFSAGGGSSTGAGCCTYQGNTGFAQYAAGGEFVAAQTIGLGAELGGVKKQSSFVYLSVDASFHLFRKASGKADPFITGGYTHASDLFTTANGANFGVGLNYWLKRHFGVRAEFRDMVFPASGVTANFWAIRGGIAFR
jgi:hypothetical protein